MKTSKSAQANGVQSLPTLQRTANPESSAHRRERSESKHERSEKMKTTRLNLAMAAIVLLALLPALARAQGSVPTTVSYQGRVTVDGEPFHGDGLFKFAILDSQGRSTWSNDGTSSDGSEPADFVGLQVEQGLFNVLLGDSSLMEPLNAEVLRRRQHLLAGVVQPGWGRVHPSRRPAHRRRALRLPGGRARPLGRDLERQRYGTVAEQQRLGHRCQHR